MDFFFFSVQFHPKSLFLSHVVSYLYQCTLHNSRLGQHKKNPTLIEFCWSDLTYKQQSSRIYRSAGTPLLLLSTLVYSKVALKCLQRGKSGLNFKSDQRVSISECFETQFFSKASFFSLQLKLYSILIALGQTFCKMIPLHLLRFYLSPEKLRQTKCFLFNF